MKKKNIIGLLISVILVISLICPISALAATEFNVNDIASASDQAEIQRAEETEWFYFNIDGKIYMRLWSYTYCYWKTDYIPCG